MIDNTALKACPFCGGDAEEKRETANRLLNPTAYYYARCKSCGATGKADLVPKHAIAAWNRRAEPANEPLTLDELREMNGEPVWVATMQEWRIVLVVREDESVRLYSVYNSISAKSVIDNDGRIYLRKPEPEGGAR